MIPDPRDQAAGSAADKFDDEHYPAYTMGRAAEMLGTTRVSCAAWTRRS